MTNDTINLKFLEYRKTYKDKLAQHKNTLWAKYKLRYPITQEFKERKNK